MERLGVVGCQNGVGAAAWGGCLFACIPGDPALGAVTDFHWGGEMVLRVLKVQNMCAGREESLQRQVSPGHPRAFSLLNCQCVQ